MSTKLAMRRAFALALMTFGAAFSGGSVAFAFDFEAGDYYATEGWEYLRPTIFQYSKSGALKGSLELDFRNATAIKGISYHDGLMYGVLHDIEDTNGYRVAAFDQTGAIKQEYRQSGAFTHLWHGNIAFDGDKNFYVGESLGITRFTVGEPDSTKRIANLGDARDVTVLENGNLMTMASHDLMELSRDGELIRTITLSDPDHVAGDRVPSIWNMHALEVSRSTGDIFLSLNGNSDLNILRMDSSGRLVAATNVQDGGDILLTDDNRVIVGSFSQSPTIFTDRLTRSGEFEGRRMMYLTQIPAVPEPSAFCLLGAGLLAINFRARKQPRNEA